MFGFPKANRSDSEAFKTNLLRSVVRRLEYEYNDLVLQNKDQIASLFAKQLPRVSKIIDQGYKVEAGVESEPVFKPYEQSNNGYQLKSTDGQKVLTVTTSYIVFEVGGDVYRRFESLREENALIQQLLTLCSVKFLTKIALRKINIARYTTSESDVDGNPFDFAEFAFNPSLIPVHLAFPNPRIIQQSIHSINYVAEDAFMNVKYGLFVSPKEEASRHLFVDIDIFNKAVTPVSSMMETLVAINDETYNVFHWILSESILETLKTN